MCGIVGVLSSTPTESELVVAMRDRLAHRGPDAAGLWRGSNGRVCLGHRRLAIIDPAPGSDQPMASLDGRFRITFNGEIYNYRALRTELESEGVVFRTRSDTEVLIECWRRWGAASLTRLSGMFAFALWDEEERTLICARDRVGEKPFHYVELDGALLFASELKAFAAWPRFSRPIDPIAVADFLTFGFILDPRTIWSGVHKLPAGHWMQVHLPLDGPPRVGAPRCYWDLSFSPDESVRDWTGPIRDALTAAADEMAVSDVPIGTFLSGGVDSSAVTAALSRAGHEVRSFTIGFDDAGYDERRYARLVAERYHTAHRERVVAPDDMIAMGAAVMAQYDEPFGDYSALPTYALCHEARREITVALSGDGGDEVFGGYSRYQRVAARARAEALFTPPLARLGARTVARMARGQSTRRTLRQYAGAPAAMFTDMLTLGLDRPSLRALAHGALAEGLAHYDPEESIAALMRQAPPSEVGLVNTMRYLDLHTTLTAGILTKVDRASMAVALEVRPVFLHHGLMTLASRIPTRHLAGPGRAKHALKRALEPWLPREVLYRPKMGFALPLGPWLRLEGEGAAPAVPSVERIADLVDPAEVERMRREHRTHEADHKATLYNLSFLDQWLTRWT